MVIAAADYDRLKEEHAELLETLALLRRYVFGPRRERCCSGKRSRGSRTTC